MNIEQRGDWLEEIGFSNSLSDCENAISIVPDPVFRSILNDDFCFSVSDDVHNLKRIGSLV